MTKLENPVRRETGVYIKGRPLIIEARPGYLRLREKGRRFFVAVDYRAIYDLGFKIIARQKAAERAEARKQKKLAQKKRRKK